MVCDDNGDGNCRWRVHAVHRAPFWFQGRDSRKPLRLEPEHYGMFWLCRSKAYALLNCYILRVTGHAHGAVEECIK